MNPSRFDVIAKALAANTSRREAILGLGAAIAAGIVGLKRMGIDVHAQGEVPPSPTSGLYPDYPPSYVNPNWSQSDFFELQITDPSGLSPDIILHENEVGELIAIGRNETGEIVALDLIDRNDIGELVAVNLIDPNVLGTPIAVNLIERNDMGTPIAIDLMDLPESGTPVPEATPPPEAICDAWDDSQKVEHYDGSLGVPTDFVAAHQSPVGNLVWNSNLKTIYQDPGNVNHPMTGEGRRYCSGTLIADNLFLTAAHCFDPMPQSSSDVKVPRKNGTNEPISREEIAKNMHVSFNYQENVAGILRAETIVPVEGFVEDGWGGADGENGVDYAILRLFGNPGQAFGHMRIATQDVPGNGMLCIISHPQQDNNRNIKRIIGGPVFAVEPPTGRKIIHRLDTEVGSSGGPILESPQGPLVGIHTNGGCLTHGYNYGMRIGALLEVSPILRDLANT
jgi:hypothetical protein